MNILELDSYNLADAVKFHDRLNHRLWDSSEHLRPDVHAKLMEIVQDFQEFLGVPDLDVKDITISGSNAAYNYTPNSDIDLHLVVDLPEADSSEVYRELFDAKKFQYNAQHNIKIGGYDVELYVQNSNQEHHSQGIYSLLRNAWVSVPKRKKADIDDISTRSKYEDLAARVDDVIRSGSHDHMSELMKKIRAMRQSGLEQQGEFGADNLAFKMLRNNGYIKRLVDARNAARDAELSLAELSRPKQRVQYGFMSESPDGVDPTTKMFLEEPVDESPDGVNPTTKMFLDESDIDSVLSRFFNNCIDFLEIENAPEMVLHHNTDWSENTGSFGQFDPDSNMLHLATSGRHVLDILRTMAHELTHCRQNEKHTLPLNAGETGSRWEDEANAMAGRIMRHWADEHPEMFKDVSLEESASGYIPKNKKQARDPRYSMALSVDIKPGQVGKEANKLALNTGRNGEPQLLMKSANLRESRMPQPSQGPGKYRDLNEPLGPESPPTMPKGTVRVDVSDVYDWYKLGQHISNMKGLGKHDFGSGPPSSIISFGDEETEHKFIKDLEATGLDVTDIDPKDPKQPQGMRRIKTDPTYNVAENELAESLRQELALFEDDLFEIRMSPSSLRQEAARTGALAGMEFEMIVPNVQGDPGDFESEPDYDRDERCRSIEDAVQFFYDGDFNGRRDIERLREKMNEDYLEWLDGKIEEEWDNDGEEYIQEWVANNVDEDEWNPDGLEGSDRQGALEEFATNVHADPMSDYYQQARDEFREERQDGWDESDWLDAEDLDRMSDIENAYNINWPYYTEPGDEYGQAEISDVAQDFQDSIGRDTYAADSYHSSGTLRPSPSRIRYVVEPDGSLEGDNPGDRGLEFVSPPLPIDEILSDLNKVKAWAKAYGCYTNDSTGLHINISVPDYDRTKLDFVKLALLMGDKYVLDAFGRSGNTYARSAFDIVKRAVRDNPEEAAKLLDKMKGNLDSLATKAIHSGVTQKYTSINTKDGHIEFRSPGGDWLDQNFDQIENTLLRFTVAMSAALNPEMYRKEYLTKLYKLLSENNKDVDTIKYFSDYVAGKIPRAALRSFVKQAQLERRLKRDPTEGERYWWRVDKEGRGRDGASIELVATSKKEALEKAREEWRIPAGDAAMRRAEAYPLRPYTDTKQADTGSGPTLNGRPSNPDGRYVIVPEQDRQTVYYRFQAAGPDDAAIVLRQWRQEHPGRIWLTLRDDNGVLGQPEGTATPRFGLWDFSEGGFINSQGQVGQGGQLIGGDSFDAARAAARRNGLVSRLDMGEVEIRRIPEEQPQNWRDQLRQHLQGNWGIWLRNENRFSRAPDQPDNSVLRRFPSREAAEQFIAQARENNPNTRTDIEVREIEPEGGFQFELSQTDIENRLGWGGQAADANYEVVNRATMQPVFKFIANTPEEANTKYAQILGAMGMPPETEDYGYRDIVVPGSTIDLQRRRAAAASDNVFGITGQPSDRTDGRNTNYSFRDLFGTNATQLINYELYNRLTDQVIDTFPARNDGEAQTRLNDYRQFGAGQSSPDHFGVRRGPGVDNTVAQTTDQQQGGIVDVAPDVAQNFGSGTFSGEWRVMIDGEEVYRFGGVGNNQGDANRIGRDWVLNQIRQRRLNPADGADVEVVPVMTESVAEGQDLQEIENIPAYMFAGGKDMLDYMPPPSKKRLKPLPGGTDLMYAIETMGPETRVQIVDPGIPGITRPDVVAVLNLDPVHYLPNTVQVGSITVDEDYRGRGLARALYGIVFTVMRKNLLSGDSQTPGGRKNWLSLARIPGVEVHGLVRIPNQVFDMNKTAVPSPGYQKYADRVMDQVMQLGGQYFSKSNHSSYWLFDVVPGKGSLQPAVKNSLSKLYGYDADNLLLATWTGA